MMRHFAPKPKVGRAFAHLAMKSMMIPFVKICKHYNCNILILLLKLINSSYLNLIFQFIHVIVLSDVLSLVGLEDATDRNGRHDAPVVAGGGASICWAGMGAAREELHGHTRRLPQLGTIGRVPEQPCVHARRVPPLLRPLRRPAAAAEWERLIALSAWG